MSRTKKAPSWGSVPTGITILATPNGWRHTIHASGFLCGRLGLPSGASDDDAKVAAEMMLASLALDFHGVDLEVDWSPGLSPRTWNGEARHV